MERIGITSRPKSWLPVLLVVIGVLPYLQVIGSEFTFDSVTVILSDLRLREAKWDNLRRILMEDYWSPNVLGLYRPLTTASFWLNYAVWGGGENPSGYQIFNIVLHGLNILLVWRLFSVLKFPATVAVVSVATFAVHPLATESVSNLVGRSDLLAAFFVMASLLLFVCARSRKANARYVFLALAGLSAALGSLSKESAVTVIGVVVLYDFCFAEDPSWKDRLHWREYLWIALPIAAVWTFRAWLYWGIPLPGVSYMDNPLQGAGLIQWQVTAFSIIARYWSWIVFPYQQSVDYSYNAIPLVEIPPAGWADIAAIVAALTVVSVSILGLTRLRKEPLGWFGFYFFLGTLAPASNVLKPVASIAGERFLYLPMVGVAVIIAALLTGVRLNGPLSMLGWKRARHIALVGITLWVMALLIKTSLRNADWKNNVTLFRSAVQTAPNSARNHGAYAAALFKQASADGTLRDHLDQIIHHASRSHKIMGNLHVGKQNSKVTLDLVTYLMLQAEFVQHDQAKRIIILQKAHDVLAPVIEELERDPANVLWDSRSVGNRAIALSNEIQTSILLKAARLAIEMEAFDRAIRMADLGLSFAPISHDLYYVRGRAAGRSGNAERCLIDVMKAFILAPKSYQDKHWEILEKIWKANDLPGSATTQAGERRGLDMGNPAVHPYVFQACREIYVAIASVDSELAASFLSQLDAQFNLKLEQDTLRTLD